MVSLREAPSAPLAVGEKFETALPQLFHELEAWRRECLRRPPAAGDLPAADRKAVRQGLVLLGVFIALTYVVPAVHLVPGALATVWRGVV